MTRAEYEKALAKIEKRWGLAYQGRPQGRAGASVKRAALEQMFRQDFPEGSTTALFRPYGK